MIGCLAAALGGLLLALAFPPWRLDVFAWVAFVPLFHGLDGNSAALRGALLAALFGAAFFLVDVRWVYNTLVVHGHFSPFPAVLMCVALVLFLSVFPALFGLFVTLLTRHGLPLGPVAPFAWVATEYLRAVVFTGFPWDLAGYAQVERLPIMQVVDITGVYGVSFLIVLVNAALWELGRSLARGIDLPWRLLSASGLVLVVTLGYGHLRLMEYPGKLSRDGFPVAVLQGNIPQDVKWEMTERSRTFETYDRLGRQAVFRGARLLIWPETSAPVLFGGPDLDWRVPGMIAENLGVPMLVGAPSMRVVHGKTVYHNSAFLVDGAGIRYRYDKIHLVPFGEYMPLSWLLPLGPGIAAREEDYGPGTTMTVMRTDGGPRFSVLICYEAIFPELAREAVRNGAQLLVNITNDGWFGRSAAPRQHLAIAGVRSIENRVWMLRAANTGISAGFDPAGRLVSRIPLEQEGLFVVTIPETPVVLTFYSRFGDVFAYACLGLVAASLIRASWSELRSHGGG
jgi:apolipoprotein N-acyltransferase